MAEIKLGSPTPAPMLRHEIDSTGQERRWVRGGSEDLHEVDPAEVSQISQIEPSEESKMTEPKNHQISVHEGAETEDTASPAFVVERTEYEVVNPIFKRGKQFRKGSTIELDEHTAKAFLDAGDIKKKKGAKTVMFDPNKETDS